MSNENKEMSKDTLDNLFGLIEVPVRLGGSSRRVSPRSKGVDPIDADQTRTLRAHREELARNPTAYHTDIARVQETVVHHLKKCGFARITRTRCAALVDQFVDAIFDTQNRLPFFHIDSDLPYCWNRPNDWDKNYIRYEWGHLSSRNQNESAHHIENLCLQSARCNQHIQTSMDIEEVLFWLDGSRVAERVRTVLERRRQLFGSDRWKDILNELARFR